MPQNTSYKDTVFRSIFNDAREFISLYNAISGSDYPPGTPLEAVNLDSALFRALRNDVAFKLDQKLIVLVEHQSTLNQNMPLRMLLYITCIYEKLLDKENIYKKSLVRIPRPEFYVLYNGVEKSEERWILRLSDAFWGAGAKSGIFELEVTMINVNAGHNKALLEKCGTLNDYALFVEKTRAFPGLSREEGFKRAIDECIKNGILKEYLIKNSSEVNNMLSVEWNMDDALAVRYEEGLEQGISQGIERGISQGVFQGREEGRNYAVLNLLNYGMKPDDISRALNMPLDVVLGCRAANPR